MIKDFYDLVRNNPVDESELKRKRMDEANYVDKLKVERNIAYSNYFMNEFACFIEEIVSRYHNLNDKLEDLYYGNIKVTYSNYNNDSNLIVVNNFLKSHNLGKLEDNIIFWEDKTTVKNLIDAYNLEIANYQKDVVTLIELQNKYKELLESTSIEYAYKLTDKFKDFIRIYGEGVSNNVSAKVYYYVQCKLEKRNYDINEYETRDFTDLSYYDDSTSWDRCNPDERFSIFLSKDCDIHAFTYSLLTGKKEFDINNKDQLKSLIEDIEIDRTKEIEKKLILK